MFAYSSRSVEPLIQELLTQAPGVLIVGPRASGKTTTASRHAATVIRLDKPSDAVAFQADPDGSLVGLREPILLDEWQAVPEVLGAVKRAVDSDPKPGRFLLTGSVRADLSAPTWPGTGRVVRVPLYGMTVAERLGRPNIKPFLDRLSSEELLTAPAATLGLKEYVELALQSGFPEAVFALSGKPRRLWIESYLEQLITRDALHLAALREPTKLRRYFECYALNSAGIVDDKTLFDASGLNRKTASGYEELLTNLMVIEQVPSWSTNRLKRLIRMPKRYVMDAALMAGLLRVDESAFLHDGDLLGRLLDTFVASQLRPESTTAACRPRFYHLRQEQGRHEVDLVAEISGLRVVGIEVKASAAPRREAADHLMWLRDELKERFVKGVVLHTGTRVYEIDDRIWAAPIASLWS